MVTGGMLVLPLTHQVLRDLVDVSVEAPEELTQITFVMSLPPAPFVPPEAVGMPAVVVMPVHAGPLDDGTAAMAPFRCDRHAARRHGRPDAIPGDVRADRGRRAAGTGRRALGVHA